MPADAMFKDVTPTAIEQANILLKFLAERCRSDWQNVFTEALGENELELNIKNVQIGLERIKKKVPLGALLGGTGIAKQEAGLDGEDSQRAIRLLKQTGRLVQAGRGRGKALCILDDTPLQAEDFIAPVAHDAEAAVAATFGKKVPEVPASIPALVLALKKEFENLQDDLLSAQKKLAAQGDVNERAEKAEARVAELEAELEKQKRMTAATTWS